MQGLKLGVRGPLGEGVSTVCGRVHALILIAVIPSSGVACRDPAMRTWRQPVWRHGFTLAVAVQRPQLQTHLT